KDVYTKFKTYVIDNRIEKEDILKELLELSKIYSNLIKSSFQDLEINYYLKQFNLINVNTIWPFMLHLFVDYQNQKIELDTLKKCIILMRNHLVRAIIVSPKGIKEWNKFYPILYNRTISNIQNNDNYFDSIASYLIYEKANTNRRFANDYEFEKALLEDKIINTNKVIANLILFEIEKTVNCNNYLLEEYTNYKLEHILPLKRQKQWEEEIGINSYSQTIEKYGSTLGNLT
ncbi:MAG: DUF1524 domain-containing protein, partial [Mycoplasma sp.]|nr:DUF1524 domain-containing protein [Mycoplasma sp.]